MDLKAFTVISEILERILFSRIALKDIKQLGYDLSTLVIDRVIGPFPMLLFFAKFLEKKLT